MAAPERPQRPPENDEELLNRFEHISADENTIERFWKFERFYDEMDALNEQDDGNQKDDEQGTLPTSRA